MILRRRAKYLTVYKFLGEYFRSRRLPGGPTARGLYKNLQTPLCFGLLLNLHLQRGNTRIARYVNVCEKNV